MEDSSSSVWQYDLRGRLATETIEIIGVGTYTTEWTYSSADLLIGMTYPNGEIVSTSYALHVIFPLPSVQFSEIFTISENYPGILKDQSHLPPLITSDLDRT